MKIKKSFTQAFFTIVAVIFLFASCKDKDQPVTKQEALQAAEKITESIAAGKASYVNDFIDEKSFSRKISKAGNSSKKDMITGIMQGLRQNRIGDQIIKAIGDKGNYELVKSYEKDGRQHLLFRMFADSKLNYHDFELTKTDREVKASDIFVYLTGDWLTNTLSQTLNAMSEENMMMLNTNSIQSIRSKMSAGNYESAKEAFDGMPESIKNEKLFQMMNIQICSALDDSSYSAAMEKYKKLYPNEPNMYLMMIDYYFLKKDYSRSLDAVDKMDALIDKDPFLDYYRGLIYNMMEEKPKAIEKLEQLQESMPHFTAGTEELIMYYIDTKSYDKAVMLIKKFKTDKNYSQEFVTRIFKLYPVLEEKMLGVKS